MKKSILLLRGVPGSGKSTLAILLSENDKYPIFAIDNYFTNDEGNYNFDFSKNHLAYENCIQNTRKAMIESCEKIIVDNTFIFDWEMKPYFDLANQYNYQLFCVVVENHHGNKNVHNIKQSDVEKMAAKINLKHY
jgi:predicted kinase